MDPDLQLYVPPDFDDAGADAQVHPMATLLFTARTNAEAFAQAQRWLTEHNVTLVDVSWKHLAHEPEPMLLTLYFAFERPDPIE